jgi:hypothetical protein
MFEPERDRRSKCFGQSLDSSQSFVAGHPIHAASLPVSESGSGYGCRATVRQDVSYDLRRSNGVANH